MPYKDPERAAESRKQWEERHREARKRYKAEWYQRTKAERRAQQNRYRRQDQEQEALALINSIEKDAEETNNEEETS